MIAEPKWRSRRAFEAYTGLSRVDRASRIIYGVKVLGRSSAWGRTYMDEAIQRDYRAYEGIKVYMGELSGVKVGKGGMHLDLRHQRFTKRPKTPLAGTLKNARPSKEGVYANLVVEAGATGDLILDAAEKCPESFGLSHVAAVEAASVPTLEGGRTELVRAFGPVHYVEVVSNPATNKNLFEGMDMADMATAEPAAAGYMGIEEAFDALKMAFVHEFEEADLAKALTQLSKFKEKILGGGDDTSSEEDGAPPAASEGVGGVADPSAQPLNAVRRSSLLSAISENNALLRQLIEGQTAAGAVGGGRRLLPTRSGGRQPVQEGGGPPVPPAKPEKIPYGDPAAMRRWLGG